MKKRLFATAASWAALSLVALGGCGSESDAEAGACTIADVGDGTSVIRCPDGSELVVRNGRDGADGQGKDGKNGQDGKDANDEPSCTLSDNGDGTQSLTCGETSIVLGSSCEDGFNGSVLVTDPANDEPISLTLFQISGCTWVRGDVLIDEYPDAELPKVLSRIEKIDGDLMFWFNEELTTISFPELKSVGNNLAWLGNTSLEFAGSFPKLETVGNMMGWNYNESLVDVGEFPALESVGNHLGWTDNINLESAGSFPKLKTVGGTLGWEFNDSLVSTFEFPALESVGGKLSWRYNLKLATIGGFPALKTVGDALKFDSEVIESIGSFAKLTSVGGLIVKGTLLEALPDFAALETIEGDLSVVSNDLLASLEGLESLLRVDGDFTVENNESLADCLVDDLYDAVVAADGVGGSYRNANNGPHLTVCP